VEQYGTLAALMAPFAALEVALWWRRRRHHARLARWAAHEGWTYTARDDGWVDTWPGYPFGRGWFRRAQSVMTGTYGPHGALVLEHSHRDDRHYHFRIAYAVHALALPAPLPWTHLSAEGLGDRAAALVGGQDIELESDEFNRAYRVRSDDRRFASDLLNPRTMELLLRRGSPDIRIGAGYIVLVTDGPVDPTSIDAALALLAAVLENLPGFVWSDRGAQVPRTRGGRP
jgi:hypothetical protein